MTIEEFAELLPDYAYDMKQNLVFVLGNQEPSAITNKNRAAVALAAAMTTNSKTLVTAIEHYTEQFLTETEIKGVKIAHSLMSMTNIYYRFLHISDNKEYKFMPPDLKMNAKRKPGLDQISYELAALGVSAINNCKACIDYHELSLRRMHVSKEGVQDSIRIAAVINAVGELLKFE